MTDHRPAISTKQAGAAPVIRRVSAKLRTAIKLRVEQGLTITEACLRAGISEAGWHKAMKRQIVQDTYEQTELHFITTICKRRKTYAARAIEVAAELMERAQSEQVRMRAVEFFDSERGQPLVNVNINGGPAPYNLTRPGSVIDHQKKAQPDVQSGGDIEQAIDITPQSDD